jgi:hypothetical protein
MPISTRPGGGLPGRWRRCRASSSSRPGRIVAGAGTGRAVTLFNCFVMGTIPDDMGGIFERVREAALTMQQGGGIGTISRPAAARARW